MTGIIILIVMFVLFHLSMAIWSRLIQKNKGYSGGFWIGLFFGIFGVLHSKKLPDKSFQKMVQDSLKEQFAFAFSQMAKQKNIGDGKPMNENMNEEFLMSIKPRLLFGFTNAQERFDTAMEKFNKGEELLPDEMNIIVLAYIFGNFNCSKDLEVANKFVDEFYNKLMVKKCTVKDKDYPKWLYYYCTINILYGLVYSYQKEYVKSAYHFMAGLKHSIVGLSMPICDYIKYICNKLNDFDCDEYEFVGTGSSPNTPAGYSGSINLDPTFAPSFISKMVGLDDEMVIAKIGNSGLYGTLERIGSYSSTEYPCLIDKYFTYLIDKNYKLYKLFIYINNYRGELNKPENILVPANFKLIKELEEDE